MLGVVVDVRGWVTSQKQEAQSSSIFFLLLMDPSKERLVLPANPSNVSTRRKKNHKPPGYPFVQETDSLRMQKKATRWAVIQAIL
jgi:hypothetical protein